MELVLAVSKRELASIDVIGMEDYPFEAVLGKEVGKGFMEVGLSILRIHPSPSYTPAAVS